MTVAPDTEQATDGRYMVPSVRMAMRILKFLKRRDQRRATAAEIGKSLGISKTTTFTILKTLHSGDFVSYEGATKRYSLGLELLELGAVVADEMDVVALARPFVRELALQAQETSVIVRWVKDRFIVLHCEEPARDVRVTMAVGQHFRYVSGAFGKAYLAFAGKDHAGEILRQVPLRPSTPHSITHMGAFTEELARCRQSGYAEGYEEAVLGVNGIASPVFGRDGEVALVIGILGFSSSLSPDLMRLDGDLVRETARKISAALGGSDPLTRAPLASEPVSPGAR